MPGLLSDVLPAVYSASNVMKNKLRGLLDDPLGTLQQALGDANDRARSFNELGARATAEDVASIKAGKGLGMGSPANQELINQISGAYNPAGMILYHGSNLPAMALKEIKNNGVFGGIFASPNKHVAQSHILGDGGLYRMTVPDRQIMKNADDVPYEMAASIVKKNTANPNLVGDIADMVLYNKSAWNSSMDEADLLKALRVSDVGEADWALQNLKGKVAKAGGFKAVEMPDEHGVSYLVLPGTKPRPVLERNGQPVNALRGLLAP